MTESQNPISVRPLPANAAEADKLIRPKVMIFTVIVVLMVFGGMLIGVILPMKMHKSPNSLSAFFVDLATAAVFMGIYFFGSSRMVKLLTDYGRNFVERGQWADAEEMLSSFNSWGQHFLDTTGEGHYLLSIALTKRGKPQTAQKARDYVLKHRPQSEWAQKLTAQGVAVSAAAINRRSQEKTGKPSKTKRRRY